MAHDEELLSADGRLWTRGETGGMVSPILGMTKSRWIEVVEWCVLTAIAVFLIGVLLTSADLESGSDLAETPILAADE